MAVAVKVGPWGALGGQSCDIPNGSMHQSLVRITICSSQAFGGPILGISFVYVDQNGGPVVGGPWGRIDPQQRITYIEIAPDEYLNNLSGTFDDSALYTLKLVTNQEHEYTAGNPEVPHSQSFSVPLGNGKVVAFFGRSDDTIKALGIYVPVMQGSPVKVGPWGGYGGEPVDVDITTPVQLKSRVTIYSTQGNGGRICGFSFTYIDLTGQPIIIRPWGTAVGQENTFYLNQGEYVNNISGTFDNDGVISLKFTTNQTRHYGPYGGASGTAFSGPLAVDDRDGKGAVVGFFGRSGEGLIALGVYIGLVPKPEP